MGTIGLITNTCFPENYTTQPSRYLKISEVRGGEERTGTNPVTLVHPPSGTACPASPYAACVAQIGVGRPTWPCPASSHVCSSLQAAAAWGLRSEQPESQRVILRGTVLYHTGPESDWTHRRLAHLLWVVEDQRYQALRFRRHGALIDDHLTSADGLNQAGRGRLGTRAQDDVMISELVYPGITQKTFVPASRESSTFQLQTGLTGTRG